MSGDIRLRTSFRFMRRDAGADRDVRARSPRLQSIRLTSFSEDQSSPQAPAGVVLASVRFMYKLATCIGHKGQHVQYDETNRPPDSRETVCCSTHQSGVRPRRWNPGRNTICSEPEVDRGSLPTLCSANAYGPHRPMHLHGSDVKLSGKHAAPSSSRGKTFANRAMQSASDRQCDPRTGSYEREPVGRSQKEEIVNFNDSPDAASTFWMNFSKGNSIVPAIITVTSKDKVPFNIADAMRLHGGFFVAAWTIGSFPAWAKGIVADEAVFYMLTHRIAQRVMEPIIAILPERIAFPVEGYLEARQPDSHLIPDAIRCRAHSLAIS